MKENLASVLKDLRVDIATLVDDNGQLRAHYMQERSGIWPVHGYRVMQSRYVCDQDTGGIMTITASPEDRLAIQEAVRKYFSGQGVEFKFCE